MSMFHQVSMSMVSSSEHVDVSSSEHVDASSSEHVDASLSEHVDCFLKWDSHAEGVEQPNSLVASTSRRTCQDNTESAPALSNR
jgi:hypothetical protein